MYYECVLCNKNVNIQVYILNNNEPFVCPECLQKKFKSKCIKCQKEILISPMEISKCIECYKKSLLNNI